MPHPLTPVARGFAFLALGNAATCLVVERTANRDAFTIALFAIAVVLLCASSFAEERATNCGFGREES